jgi:hypothetical protein
MILHQNLMTKTGLLLMPKGHEVTDTLLERIENFSRRVGVKEPILVSGARPSGTQKAVAR